MIKTYTEQGFTLIELLVVIVIIGILSAIALPTFLNQAMKARLSEARTYTGSFNRAQQVYHVENGEFATNLDTLGIEIPQETANYTYGQSTDNVANNETILSATPVINGLNGYASKVRLDIASGTPRLLTMQCIGELNELPDMTGVITQADCEP